MKIILAILLTFLCLETLSWSGVYVIEGFEDFEAASLDELMDVIGDKMTNKDLWIRRKAVNIIYDLFIRSEIKLGHYLKQDSKIRLLTLDWVNVKDFSASARDEAITHLITALTDEDAFIRRKAVMALGASSDKRAIEPLNYLLKVEEDSAVIREIKRALKNLGHTIGE